MLVTCLHFGSGGVGGDDLDNIITQFEINVLSCTINHNFTGLRLHIVNKQQAKGHCVVRKGRA